MAQNCVAPCMVETWYRDKCDGLPLKRTILSQVQPDTTLRSDIDLLVKFPI